MAHQQESSLAGRACRRWLARARHALHRREYENATVLSMVFFTACFCINLLAVQYASDHVSNYVTDIVLSNIPVFDVDGLFVYGTFVFTAFVLALMLAHPKRIPFMLNSLGLLWLIRSAFTSLTHIAPYPQHTAIAFGPAITKVFFGGDLFFSGHTATPVLFALIFWRRPILRFAFLLWAVFFATVVLLGHLHYSIDVAAAFFITYTIYEIARRVFPRSREIFYAPEECAGD